MVNDLPYPANLKEISRLVGPLVDQLEAEMWPAKRTTPEHIIRFFKVIKQPIVDKSYSMYSALNQYSLFRATNQLCEAANKLWSTVELYAQVRRFPRFCKQFNTGFLLSSTIPTLYYANMSAMLSIMTCYGIISIRSQGQSINLIRTEDGFKLFNREKYLRDMFGQCPHGWHDQIIQMYEEFPQKGINLPDINLKKVKELKGLRNQYHYDILSETTMANVFGEIQYFNRLDNVLHSVQVGLDTITKIQPTPMKGIKPRVIELTIKIKTLHEIYGQ
jgi:hypothetical protein